MKIIKCLLPWESSQNTQAMIFLPAADVQPKASLGVFSHGYTADKTDLLPWVMRLAEEGMGSIIFDWPGHYLGNFSEVTDFDYFKSDAHKLFVSAFEKLREQFSEHFPLNEHDLEFDKLNLVLGGRSLGALLALYALEEPIFSDYQNKRALAVGLGITPPGKTHLFKSNFYKSTLNIRGQLVSPAINPDTVFSWIKEAKENVPCVNQQIHIINGEDDLVVGDLGGQLMVKLLQEKGNLVTLERPTRLPHHEPKQAASYIKRYLKKEELI
jgi:predicted esterase